MSVATTSVALSDDKAGRRGSAARRILKHLALFAGLLALWEYVTWSGLVDALIVPRPSEIAVAIVRIYYIQGNIWRHLWITMSEVLVGFLVGSLLGIGLAVAAGLSEVLRRYLKPYVIVMEATPRIAMAPLLIAWLGFGFSSKIAIVTLVCFFAPFVNTLTGMLMADQDRMEMMRSLRARQSQIFWKLMLPGALPIIMAGLRLAMASALAGALVAEFISANQGMGVILNRYTQTLNMSSAFASLLTLTAVGFLLYRTMEIIEARIVFWQNDAGIERVAKGRAVRWKTA